MRTEIHAELDFLFTAFPWISERKIYKQQCPSQQAVEDCQHSYFAFPYVRRLS